MRFFFGALFGIQNSFKQMDFFMQMKGNKKDKKKERKTVHAKLFQAKNNIKPKKFNFKFRKTISLGEFTFEHYIQ